MNKDPFLKHTIELLNNTLMTPGSDLLFFAAIGIVVLFAAFALKFSLNVMNAGFPSFFGAIVAVVLGGAAMLFAASAGGKFLGDFGQGATVGIGVMIGCALAGLLLIGAPLAAFLCRSKYMSALGSWFVAIVVAGVGVIAFNAATAGFKTSESVIERTLERKDRIEDAVKQ